MLKRIAIISTRQIHQTLRLGLVAAAVALVIGVAGIGTARTFDAGRRTAAHSAGQSALNSQSDSIELLHTVSLAPSHSHKVTRVMMMEVTAYCACPKCCGPNAQGITASGKGVSYNAGKFVAADPSLAFGTKLMIPGYDARPVEVIDRGGAIKGNKLDVFFPTHEAALEWGRRTVAVSVVE
ncbi:MAG TPA: 3D domain-containing protein [Tepidisphaeraceae bacterium]|jgi:3D (Asp-Asp-Asp) domain-containing protein